MHLFTLIFHNGISFGPSTRLHFSDDLSLQLTKGLSWIWKKRGCSSKNNNQIPKKTSLEHGPGIHVDISTCKTLSNTFKAGTHQATSCSNMSWWHVTAKLLRVYWRIFVKIFVTATEFCRSNMLPKIKSDRICETCCGDKILLQRQIFSQNFSGTHEAICCCNLSQTVPTFFVQTVALPP